MSPASVIMSVASVSPPPADSSAVAALPANQSTYYQDLHARLILSRKSMLRYILESAVLCAVILTVVLVPLQLAFHSHHLDTYFWKTDFAIDFIFSLNIVISFFTAFEGDFFSFWVVAFEFLFLIALFFSFLTS
jgi:hypothetical protein